MKCFELASLLMETPNKEVVLKVGDDWVEVCGTKPTLRHKNALTFEVVNPGCGGVIVVEPDDGGK